MIYYKDLCNIKDEKVYEFFYENIEIKDNLFLRSIKQCDGYFVFFYDAEEKLKIEYKMVGFLVCPDAYTLEDVEVPFEVEDEEYVTEDMSKEGIYLDKSNKEEDIIKQILMPIVPIKVVKSEKIEYSRGDGWSVLREEELTKNDPRLEKIKEFKGE